MKNITNGFEYFSPKSVQEAVKLMSENGEKEFKLICGGQSLNLVMRNGLVMPELLISLKSIPNQDYIKFDEKDGLRIGAMATHRSVELSPVIAKRFPVLTEMEHNISSVETRNWGTIGGNICHGDPGGDVAPVLIALNANITMASVKGERTVSAEDFSVGIYETALEHEEMATEIHVPTPPPNTGTVYYKFSQLQGDYAIAATAVSITLDKNKDKCTDVRVVLSNVGPAAFRAKSAEEILKGKKITDDLLIKAGQAASEEAQPTDSLDASAEYKKELMVVLVKRVGKEALERAMKG